MVHDTINQLITVAQGLGILGGAYLVWLISGVAKVIFTKGMKWQWKKMLEDLIKALLMCVAITAWVVLMQALDYFCKSVGIDVSALLDGVSITGLIAGILGGTVNYLTKAFKNFYNFVNTKHIEVEIKEENESQE